MFREIRIKNFKAFGKIQKVPLGKITLIYGPNSAGKSSIIQSILLMKQSTLRDRGSLEDNTILFRGEDIDLGNFDAATFQHKKENGIQIGFSFEASLDESWNDRTNLPGSRVRRVDVNIQKAPNFSNEKNGDAWIEEVDFGFLGCSMSLARLGKEKDNKQEQNEKKSILFRLKDENSVKELLRLISINDDNKNSEKKFRKKISINKSKNIEFLDFWRDIYFNSSSSLPGLFSFNMNVFDKVRNSIGIDRFSELFVGPLPFDKISKELLNEFRNVSYLGPLRSPPARHYIVSGGDKGSVGQRGERMPQLLYKRKNKLISRLNDQLKRFKIPYSVNVSNVGNDLTGDIIAMSLTDNNGITVSPSDVGFGIGQLMPILVEGTVSNGKTICVEQPEIHIHPKLQGNLADFFFETSKTQGDKSSRSVEDAFGGNQWIVESHSEALILRLQTLLKKKVIPEGFVTVLYVQPTKEGSQVIHLRLDKDGDFIDDWPEGFFEESFQEMFVNRL